MLDGVTVVIVVVVVVLVILMRHAARIPPPPDFVVSGVLHLTSFGKFQNVTQSFEVSVRYYKFSEVLCQFSADILHQIWCLTVWRSTKNDTKTVPTAMKTEAKRVNKNSFKMNPCGALEASGA